MRKMTLFLSCIMAFLLLVTACTPQGQPTDPDPIVHEINKPMYCTIFKYNPTTGHRYLSAYEMDLRCTVTEYTDQENQIDISFEAIGRAWDKAKDFKIVPGEASWPYFCATGYLYYSEDNSSDPYVLALDPEKEYMIFKSNGNTGNCTVASSDPSVNPWEILEYFEDFLVKYSYGYVISEDDSR